MRQGGALRIAPCRATVRDVFAQGQRLGRRTGAVMLVDDAGVLRGLFTDSDLARLFETRRDDLLDRPIAEVMTPQPLTVVVGARLIDAVEILQRRKISELPVVDAAGRPVGLLDITDVIGLIPKEEAEQLTRVA
jgi:arabinose-5-phosphate isomerase